MFTEDMDVIASSAAAKAEFCKRSVRGYLMASVLAGFFIGLGVLAMSTAAGILTAASSPFTKIISAFIFPAALSLVVFAGAELFTGNIFVMTVGVLEKKAFPCELLRILILSYVGNLMGSVLCALIFAATGLGTGDTLSYILSACETKTTLSALELTARGVLCNILVCLAVRCNLRMRSESARLMMIFWCIFTFVICGFEHSVANMTMLTLGLILPHGGEISGAGYVYNLFFVTLGNIIGGAAGVAVPYWMISRPKNKNKG